MVKETWKCMSCNKEITFQVKGTWKESPVGKNCECGGFWKFKEEEIKRKTMDIWKNVNLLLGLNWDVYGETIRSTQTQKDLIKLENAIKRVLGKNEVSK